MVKNIVEFAQYVREGKFSEIIEDIPCLSKEDFYYQCELDNRNTILHNAFFLADSETIIKFLERLKALSLSKEDLINLLETQNDGGYNVVDKLLQPDEDYEGEAISRLDSVLNAIKNDIDMLDVFLSVKGEEGSIYEEIMSDDNVSDLDSEELLAKIYDSIGHKDAVISISSFLPGIKVENKYFASREKIFKKHFARTALVEAIREYSFKTSLSQSRKVSDATNTLAVASSIVLKKNIQSKVAEVTKNNPQDDKPVEATIDSNIVEEGLENLFPDITYDDGQDDAAPETPGNLFPGITYHNEQNAVAVGAGDNLEFSFKEFADELKEVAYETVRLNIRKNPKNHQDTIKKFKDDVQEFIDGKITTESLRLKINEKYGEILNKKHSCYYPFQRLFFGNEDLKVEFSDNKVLSEQSLKIILRLYSGYRVLSSTSEGWDNKCSDFARKIFNREENLNIEEYLKELKIKDDQVIASLKSYYNSPASENEEFAPAEDPQIQYERQDFAEEESQIPDPQENYAQEDVALEEPQEEEVQQDSAPEGGQSTDKQQYLSRDYYYAAEAYLTLSYNKEHITWAASKITGYNISLPESASSLIDLLTIPVAWEVSKYMASPMPFASAVLRSTDGVSGFAEKVFGEEHVDYYSTSYIALDSVVVPIVSGLSICNPIVEPNSKALCLGGVLAAHVMSSIWEPAAKAYSVFSTGIVASSIVTSPAPTLIKAIEALAVGSRAAHQISDIVEDLHYLDNDGQEQDVDISGESEVLGDTLKEVLSVLIED